MVFVDNNNKRISTSEELNISANYYTYYTQEQAKRQLLALGIYKTEICISQLQVKHIAGRKVPFNLSCISVKPAVKLRNTLG